MVSGGADWQVSELYSAGYAALDRGEFREAVRVARECLSAAPPTSYWHFGALGLRCWVANYMEEDSAVERDAARLVSGDAGTDQLWFEGLAQLNLALMHERNGRRAEALECFSRAAERYSAYRAGPDQPPEWAAICEYFAAVSRWGATGDTSDLEALQSRLGQSGSSREETRQLARAVALVLRHAGGDDVREEALSAAKTGTSRAFLAPVLLVHGARSDGGRPD